MRMATYSPSVWRPVAGILLMCLAAAAADAERFQNGFRFRNGGIFPFTATYSFSGSFPGEGEICLIPESVDVPNDGMPVEVTPPDGFTVTDFVVLSIVTRLGDRGGYTLDDPPGASRISSLDVLCPPEGQRVYTYAQIGGTDYGPVTATVPLVRDGHDDDGVPRLFAAAIGADGLPVFKPEGKPCFEPTAVRVNVPGTGEIAPKFRLPGEPEVCGEIELVANAPAEPPATPDEPPAADEPPRDDRKGGGLLIVAAAIGVLLLLVLVLRFAKGRGKG